MKKVTFIILIIVIGLALFMRGDREAAKSPVKNEGGQAPVAEAPEILYYTCGMHPSVKVKPDEYDRGIKNCPICNMFLVPVYEKIKGATIDANIVSIDSKGVSLAGIETYELKIIPLSKQIETVGIVAYDPALRTAQEEYLQALNTYQKILKSDFQDAKDRAKDILEASKIKLRVLGLNQESIKELKKRGSADNSLILPEETMWVYAHLYEYELSWPQVGAKVEMISEVDPSVIIEGEIKNIEPIVQKRTRTVKLQILADNKSNILKPNMYVDVRFNMELGKALALPKEAILDTGKRKIIYVDLGQGDFQLREVVVGPLVQGIVKGEKVYFYPLVEGAEAGERVVSKGNFLIDSQSQLGAASSAFGGTLEAEEGTATPKAATHQH